MGEFLDADGKPSDLITTNILPQNNVSIFIDADGDIFDSYFVASDESRGVNIGEFIDPDDLE